MDCRPSGPGKGVTEAPNQRGSRRWFDEARGVHGATRGRVASGLLRPASLRVRPRALVLAVFPVVAGQRQEGRGAADLEVALADVPARVVADGDAQVAI